MKYNLFSSLLAVALFSLASTSLFAQKMNIWKGGAPGRENDWSFHKNWSQNRTPEAFDRVIIPDVSTTTGRFPVIQKGWFEVESLEISSHASLILMPETRLVLTSEFQNSGVCDGCDARLWISPSAAATSAAIKN